MLHELLLSLLGFTGDIIIEDAKRKTFRIKDGFDLLLQSEVDLINKIVPLGWYYNSLSAFVDRYDIGWGGTFGAQFKKSSKSSNGVDANAATSSSSSSSSFHCYHTGMSSGIADLLEEYTSDISYLEQIALTDGPIPLGKLLQFVQKYLIVMPVIQRMCEEIETKVIRGCQILDYMTSYSSGVPIINSVVQRIVLKIRSIFLKQCITWMVHGELEDPGNEFFVYAKSSSGQESKIASIVADCGSDDAHVGIHDEVMGKLLRAAGLSSNNVSSHSSTRGFDWNTSYALRLEYVPETHVSPRMASKILFVGKAVRLLKSSASPSSSAAPKSSNKEVFEYLSSGYDGALPSAPSDEVDSLEDGVEGVAGDSNAYRLHLSSCGYKPVEVLGVMNKFREILRQPDFTVELLESLVDTISNTISAKLWMLLRDSHRFTSSLQAIRSTYLMGKGELHQCILDGVLNLTSAPTPDVRSQDTQLTWDVLRVAGKLLGLDEDVFASIISLRVNNPSNSVTNFAASGKYVTMSGAARVAKGSSKLSLCSMDCVDRNTYFSYLWNFHFIKKASDLQVSTRCLSHVQKPSRDEENMAPDHENAQKSAGPLYSRGALWFTDPKYVSKGFSLSLAAEFDWNFILSRLAASHAYLNNEHGDHLVLGTLVGSLHSEKFAVDLVGSEDASAEMTGCVYAGLSLYASRNGGSISYYAKVYVKSRAPDSRFGRLSTDTFIADNNATDRSIIWGRPSRADSRSSGAATLSETIVEISLNGSAVSGKYRSIVATPSLALDIEYLRELVVPKDGRSTAGTVAYSLRVRVRDPQVQSDSKVWDIEMPLDLANHVKVTAGLSYIGVVGSGVVLDEDGAAAAASSGSIQALYSRVDGSKSRGGSRSLSISVSNIDYKGKGALSTYPVASPFTSTRFPDTFRRLETELSQIKGWMNLKLEFEIPQIFKIIFDSDSLSAYGRVFASLFKTKLVAHSLERLWKTRSRLAEDRVFCQIRHSMHYFISNLIYYLQVDVIDSEFSLLKDQISTATDFQAVLKSHRNFLSNTLRMTMVDNATVQEGIERILQVCLRFIALCRLLHQQEEDACAPELVVVIPPEEVEAIQKDFFAQISYLFAVMRKIENRGFIFRLDFNSYFSQNIV